MRQAETLTVLVLQGSPGGLAPEAGRRGGKALSFLMQLRSQRKVLTGRVQRDGSPTTASSVPSVLQTSHDLAES